MSAHPRATHVAMGHSRLVRVAAVNYAEEMADMLRRARNVLRIVQPGDATLDDIDDLLVAYSTAKEAQP